MSGTSKPSEMFGGKAIEKSNVPFENFAYATTDVDTAEGFVMYGERGLFAEIAGVMDSKREFSEDQIPLNMLPKHIVHDVLEHLKEAGALEGRGEGRYAAKKDIYVKHGRFKIPKQ
jgi:hypothetical protein